ncbi:MAG TPA: TonB-dependent receptor [Vicinamibacterales bacterium]|nr:TonB-dependent receptor [Vicinamibacterales bacterium]
MQCRPLGFSAAIVVIAVLSGTASAQTGGSLSGYIKDEQGAVLPGATVTATGSELIRPTTAVTDNAGYYRLVNLPPGEYTVTAELAGFTTVRREGILLRANANFAVDLTMRVGTLQESITVTGESPMLEVSRPSNVLNIDGEFQKELPIAARRNWTDFLEITPGVHSRPFDDGSGRMVYFGHATEHFAHVVQLEGMQAGNYNDFQLTYVQMGSDMIQDTQVKTGGADASTPMGTGLAINVITKSGGNRFGGSAGFAYQPLDWNADNASARTEFRMDDAIPVAACPDRTCVSTGGSPVQTDIKQFDGSFGGPIARDRLWFFGSLRVSRVETGIGRIDKQVNDIQAYFPGSELFPNKIKGYQPYAKVTGRLGPVHELQVVFQRDRTAGQNNWEYLYQPIDAYSNGGNLYNVKTTSAWSNALTSSFSVGYNDKSGNDANTYSVFGFEGTGPNIEIYEGTRIASGLITGNGLILEGGNVDFKTLAPASLWLIRGDLTYFKQGWVGSHEFQTGVFLEPRNTYDQIRQYSNDGFYQEHHTPIDPADPSRGTRPFRRYYADPIEITTRKARDSNYATYVQDTWKPNTRLTTSLGVRFDYVRRDDKVKNITRQTSWTIQPRLGFTYMLTPDARTVLRGSWARLGEQVMGRDAVTTFGADDTVSQRIEYDNNLDGVFETVVVNPATASDIAAAQIDPDLHQPYLDEGIVGFRKQFAGQIGLDVAYINRVYKDTWAELEINGFWPSAPGQPFGGWGRIDPNRGVITQQTNNSWSRLKYQAIELTVTKNMSHGFQFMAGINRQWHKMDGTWNPTDRAGYIAPDAFANDANLYMPRGNNDRDSLPDTGNALSYGPTWMKYRLNFGGVWQAPYGINVAGNLTVQAGPWSGAILYQLPVGDPEIARYGQASFRLPNGTTAANPLATRNRYVYSNRGEGQVQAPPITTAGIKIGKVFRLAGSQVEVAGNIFNLLNAGDFTQYSYNSAYQSWSPNFLQMRNRQPARAFQLTVIGRF